MDQDHQYYFDLFWSLGAKIVGNLLCALDQAPLSDILVDLIVDGVEDFASVGEAQMPIGALEPLDDLRMGLVEVATLVYL